MPSEHVNDSDFDASGIVFNPGEPVMFHGLRIEHAEIRYRIAPASDGPTLRISDRLSVFKFLSGKICLRSSIAVSGPADSDRGEFAVSFYSPGRNLWMAATVACDVKQHVVHTGMPLDVVCACEWRAILPAGDGGTELLAREMGFVKVDGEWVDLLDKELEASGNE